MQNVLQYYPTNFNDQKCPGNSYSENSDASTKFHSYSNLNQVSVFHFSNNSRNIQLHSLIRIEIFSSKACGDNWHVSDKNHVFSDLNHQKSKIVL